MADVFSKEKRSEVMSRIRGMGNRKTEGALIQLMKSCGVTGWRRRRPVFGKPDFVFPATGVAVFVDGCFWHGCPKHRQYPAANADFWRNKLDGNKKRDRLVTRTLRNQGWSVVRIWECQLVKNPSRCIRRIQQAIQRANCS